MLVHDNHVSGGRSIEIWHILFKRPGASFQIVKFSLLLIIPDFFFAFWPPTSDSISQKRVSILNFQPTINNYYK